MIKKFRKKPIFVEAVQWTGYNFKEIADFIGMENIRVDWQDDGSPDIGIATLEGIMHASIGDWIIQGVSKEPYPCKPDIFEKTYDRL